MTEIRLGDREKIEVGRVKVVNASEEPKWIVMQEWNGNLEIFLVDEPTEKVESRYEPKPMIDIEED